MNLQKSELKKAILNDLGNRFEDEKESLEKQVEQLAGAKSALLKMAKDIQLLHVHADKDLEDGKISDLETLKLVKLYVTRAIDACQNQARQCEVNEIRTRGRFEQADKQVRHLAKLIEDEDAKLRQLLAAIEDGSVVVDGDEIAAAGSSEIGSDTPSRPPPGNVVPMRRPVGVRPGMSIAAQRKLETQPESAQADDVDEELGQTQSGDVPEEPDQVQAESTQDDPAPAKPKRKYKRRKAKGTSVSVAPDAG